MKHYAFLFFLFAAVSFFSCSKEDATLADGVKDLISSLQKQSTDCVCKQHLDEYIWRSQTVYALSCSGPSCNCFIIYYDSEGKRFEMPEGYLFDEFLYDSKLVTTVWTCD